jgi:hypothetical protein
MTELRGMNDMGGMALKKNTGQHAPGAVGVLRAV